MTTFLTLDEVLAIHASRIELYGGSTRIRDQGLLESAIAVPEASMFGQVLHPTLHEQAAAYLFHLVQNHPFVDGNKRTGLGVALLFLALNGAWIEATEDNLVDLTLGVAKGTTSKADVAVFFQTHSEPWKA